MFKSKRGGRSSKPPALPAIPRFILEALEPRRTLSADVPAADEILHINDSTWVGGYYPPELAARRPFQAESGEGFWILNWYPDSLQITDGSGQVLWSLLHDGTQHLVSWTAPSSGVFYFQFQTKIEDQSEPCCGLPLKPYYGMKVWPDIDDFGNDPAHATPVGDKLSAEGHLEGFDDPEWFEMHGQPGEQFSLRFPTGYDLTLFDSNLNEVEPFAPKWHYQGEEIVQLQSADSYYARLTYHKPDPGPWQSWTWMPYDISITHLPADDFPDDQADATEIPLTETISGRHAWGGDTDWFKFHAQAGSTYHIYMHTPKGLTYFDLLNANGDVLQWDDMNLLPDDAMDYTATEDGDIYITTNPTAFDAALDWPSPTQYDLSVFQRSYPSEQKVIPDDGGEIDSTFSEPGQVQLFKFHAQPGIYYSFSVDHPGIQSPIELTILNLDGSPVYDHQPPGPRDWQTSEDTTYFLRVAPMNPAETGDYQLHVQQWADDHVSTSPTPIAPGQSMPGMIQFDQDWDSFTFKSDRDQKYHLTLHFPGWSSEAVGGFYIDGDNSYSNIQITPTADGAEASVVGSSLYRISLWGEPRNVPYTIQINKIEPPPPPPDSADDEDDESSTDDQQDVAIENSQWSTDDQSDWMDESDDSASSDDPWTTDDQELDWSDDSDVWASQ